MDKLKAIWARFKVQISFVAGCLVVATSLGTCSFDPSETSADVSTETTEEATTVKTTTTDTVGSATVSETVDVSADELTTETE
mgnify:CR=1 FL=1|jgi:hypothetical protein